jgi:hypothetical protein
MKKDYKIKLPNSKAPRNLVVQNDFNVASTHKDKKRLALQSKRHQKHKGGSYV